MRKALFTILFAGMVSSPLFAALPPISQSIKEVDAMLWSKEMTENLTPGDTIVEIKRVDDSFIVITEDKQMIVDIVYNKVPGRNVGPREFKLVFHAPTPLSE